MTRAPLLALLAAGLLAACQVGVSGREAFRAEGVLVVLRLADGEVVAGELLTVADTAWTVDALGADGSPSRVVRVATPAIARGSAYAGPPAGAWAARGERPPRGVAGRIARLGAGGAVVAGPDLRLLARFPHGMPDAALAALLARRAQTDVTRLPAR